MRLGTIVIFTGILPIAKDESGLAAIITHGKPNFPRSVEISYLITRVEIGHVSTSCLSNLLNGC